jgi:tetratricopeptide (TPR) repeat protein
MSYPTPNDYKFWFEQGKAMTNLGRYSEALASFERTLNLQPHNFIAWVWQAGVLTHLDDYAAALKSLDKALELCPDNVGANSEYDKQSIVLFRGVVLHELGRYKAAYASYDLALELEGEEQCSLWQRFYKAIERTLAGSSGSKRALTRPIGERLQAAGLIAAEQVDKILSYQHQHRHLRFGEIATMWGWLKPETVDFFVEQLPKLTREKRKKPLGQYLKSAALLNDFQIRMILEQQKSGKGLRFGQIAVRQGWVQQETIDFFLEYIG